MEAAIVIAVIVSAAIILAVNHASNKYREEIEANKILTDKPQSIHSADTSPEVKTAFLDLNGRPHLSIDDVQKQNRYIREARLAKAIEELFPNRDSGYFRYTIGYTSGEIASIILKNKDKLDKLYLDVIEQG